MFVQRDVFVGLLMAQGYVVICQCHPTTRSSEIILTVSQHIGIYLVMVACPFSYPVFRVSPRPPSPNLALRDHITFTLTPVSSKSRSLADLTCLQGGARSVPSLPLDLDGSLDRDLEKGTAVSRVICHFCSRIA